MINFRYHVVSLVGVFLALGVGLLFGSTLIPEANVRALEEAQRNLGEQNERLREQVEDLQDRTESLSSFVEIGEEHLVRGILRGTDVAVVSFDTTPDEALDGALGALAISEARVVSAWRLSESIDPRTDAARRQLALALAGPTQGREELLAEAIVQISAALSGGDADVLSRLAEGGLATPEPPREEGAQAAPLPTGTPVVILPPSPREDSALEDDFLMPLIGSLVDVEVLVVAGEGSTDSAGSIRLIRERSVAGVVTVDSLEGPLGRSALALGLAAGLEGRIGHWGLGEGADDPLPEFIPSPEAPRGSPAP